VQASDNVAIAVDQNKLFVLAPNQRGDAFSDHHAQNPTRSDLHLRLCHGGQALCRLPQGGQIQIKGRHRQCHL
jgi:hypothetical protein